MSLSAQQLFDAAPLGAMVAFGDGSPRPPDRFKRKLQAWVGQNATGRLINRVAGDAERDIPAAFTLQLGVHRSDGVVVLIVQRTFSVRSTLSFDVIETPPPGAILCLTPHGDTPELRHIAADQHEAAAWLRRNRYSRAFFHQVQPDGGVVALQLPDSLVA